MTTSYPYWVTFSDLGSYLEGYSFTQYPLTLVFGESLNQPCSVTLHNGSLPPGITWTSQGYQITLKGATTSVDQDTSYTFTFRASNGTYVADRSFTIRVTNFIGQSFSWVTSNTLPLLRIWKSNIETTQVSAVALPFKPVTYSLDNSGTLPLGISLTSATGEIAVDLGWKKSTYYTGGKDVIITPGGLYVCTISGYSGTNSRPTGLGSGIVDTDYPEWYPNRYYDINDVAYSDSGKIYLCTTAGYTNTNAPTGTGTNFVSGSTIWKYIDQVAVWDHGVPDNEVILTLDITASTDTQSITKSFDIWVLSTPYRPIWITTPGYLTDAVTETNYVYQLVATDPDGNILTYTSGDLPGWLNLSPQGLLYGTAPFVENATDYTFHVTLSDGVQTAPAETFIIKVTEFVTEFYWETDNFLPSILDGCLCPLKVSAVSIRPGNHVRYGLRGGMIPLGLRLNSDTGELEGFTEYHAIEKLYRFQVEAFDGTQSIRRLFEMSVVPQNQGPNWSLSYPLLGQDKELYEQAASLTYIPEPIKYSPNSPGYGFPVSPSVGIIGGIKKINAVDLRNLISDYLHNFTIKLQDMSLELSGDGKYQVLEVIARDADVVMPWQPITSYNQGVRVSNKNGDRYVALNKGVSGSSEPTGDSSNIQDGTVRWALEGATNKLTSVAWPTPWLPYHYYTSGIYVSHEGGIYKSTVAGRSGGGPGPRGLGITSDNEVLWEAQNYSYPWNVPDVWNPSNIRNIRDVLISSAGWSNAWGAGAEAIVNVSLNGQIDSVQVVSPGSGYYNIPVYNLIGAGSGAFFSFTLGVFGAEYLSGGDNLNVGDQLTVDLGHGTPAILEVTNVNEFLKGDTFVCVDPGSFSFVPSRDFELMSSNGAKVLVRLVAGVSKGVVVNPGAGYSANETFINFRGKEFDSYLNKTRDTGRTYLPLAYLEPDFTDLSTISNILNGYVLDVRLLKATLTGVTCEGISRFDTDTVSFDEDTTRFIEVYPSSEAVFDTNNTVWDTNTTTFDFIYQSIPQFSGTVFDSGNTVFDWYATLFDQAPYTTDSAFSRSWFWWFGQPWEPAK